MCNLSLFCFHLCSTFELSQSRLACSCLTPQYLPLTFISPMYTEGIERKESAVTQSCLTLCNPMDCSLPRFSVHGIFQARVLEWVYMLLNTCLFPLLSYLLLQGVSVKILEGCSGNYLSSLTVFWNVSQHLYSSK